MISQNFLIFFLLILAVIITFLQISQKPHKKLLKGGAQVHFQQYKDIGYDAISDLDVPENLYIDVPQKDFKDVEELIKCINEDVNNKNYMIALDQDYVNRDMIEYVHKYFQIHNYISLLNIRAAINEGRLISIIKYHFEYNKSTDKYCLIPIASKEFKPIAMSKNIESVTIWTDDTIFGYQFSNKEYEVPTILKNNERNKIAFVNASNEQFKKEGSGLNAGYKNEFDNMGLVDQAFLPSSQISELKKSIDQEQNWVVQSKDSNEFSAGSVHPIELEYKGQKFYFIQALAKRFIKYTDYYNIYSQYKCIWQYCLKNDIEIIYMPLLGAAIFRGDFNTILQACLISLYDTYNSSQGREKKDIEVHILSMKPTTQGSGDIQKATEQNEQIKELIRFMFK